jgi:hypothetical protein
MIKLADLRKLPLVTLRVIALSIAHQIDAGAEDQRGLLERVLGIVRARASRGLT